MKNKPLKSKSVKIWATVYDKLKDYTSKKGLKISFVLSKLVENFLEKVKSERG